MNAPTVDRLVRFHEVHQMTGLARTTIWCLEKSGSFPGRRQIGPGSVGWLQSEIQEWVRTRQVIASQPSSS
jgi:prophage regulatory protein